MRRAKVLEIDQHTNQENSETATKLSLSGSDHCKRKLATFLSRSTADGVEESGRVTVTWQTRADLRGDASTQIVDEVDEILNTLRDLLKECWQ